MLKLKVGIQKFLLTMKLKMMMIKKNKKMIKKWMKKLKDKKVNYPLKLKN